MTADFTTLSAVDLLLALAQQRTRSKAERAARGLAPMQRLLDAVGNPEHCLPKVIHITGSKGKGSTALIAESIALAGGLHVGTFTSPHLQHFRERIRLDGVPISEAPFEQAFEGIRRYCRDNPDSLPTFPEALTAAGLSVFAGSNLDVVIIEVGLGGRLDPTNVIDSDVAVLTNIELEHTLALGGTLTDIAEEKAGIFKPGKLAVIGPMVESVRPTIAKAAYRQQTVAYFMGQGIQLRQLASGWRLRLPWLKLDLPNSQQCSQMTLPHQRNNVALAVAAVIALTCIPGEQLVESIGQGLRQLTLPGKLDWQPPSDGKSARLIDSAHTTNSMQALRDFIALKFPERPTRCRLILSLAANKPMDTVLAPILPLATEILCYAPNARSLPTEALQSAIRAHPARLEHAPITMLDNQTMLKAALAATDLNEQDLVLIAGSTYLAGAVYEMLSS